MDAPAPARRKLPARYAAIVMPTVLATIMTFIISGVATLINIGPIPGFTGIWMKAWGMSFIVALPTLLAALPIVRRIVALLVETPRA
jgi:hypothetical protein